MIKKIIIHESLLTRFKGTAFNAVPFEHIEAILGKQVKEVLYVYALAEIKIFSMTNTKDMKIISYYPPEEDIQADTGYKYFGSLHTHPNGDISPSTEDIADFIRGETEEFYWEGEEQVEILNEKIMGIMSIRRRKKVYEIGIVFYNTDMEKLELVITENRKKGRQ